MCKKYRVETMISRNNYFRVDCTEDKLEYYKALCKYDALKSGGVCSYREFPLSKNEKIYYAKDSSKLTVEEVNLITTNLLKSS